MIEFVFNAVISTFTELSIFMTNYEFESRMSFDSLNTETNDRISDKKRILTQKTCHEMWLLIILEMRKSCINDRTIAKIMIIREKFYSKDVMWSVLRYSTCSNHSHILVWRWIILIELIWWFQSLSRNSIIIKARNFIIRLTI
jgi:hypothetical protein